jgi:hypothetical protein
LTEVKFRVYYWSEVRGGFTGVKFSAGLLEEERSADSLEEGGEKFRNWLIGGKI